MNELLLSTLWMTYYSNCEWIKIEIINKLVYHLNFEWIIYVLTQLRMKYYLNYEWISKLYKFWMN